MRITTTLLSFLLLLSLSNVWAQDTFFKNADSFLKKYVNDHGDVNYKAIKQDPTTLNKIVHSIGTFNFGAADTDTKKAFLINSYNLLTIHSVVQNLPISKPTDVSTFFDGKHHIVGGKKMSLDDVEKVQLPKLGKDVRLHFVLVCAAKSCPALKNGAYFPAQLDKQLTARTKVIINNPYFVRVSAYSKKAELSEIFKWYAADFDTDIIAFLNQYRIKHIPTYYKIAYYPYDWSLNKQ